MKHLKSRIIGVVILLVIISTIVCIPQIKAEEETPAPTETFQELTCIELVDKYGLYIETTDDNKFRIIKNPTTKCDDGKVYTDSSFKIIAINNVPIDGPILTKDYEFEADYLGPIEGNKFEVIVTVENVDNQNEKIEVKYSVESEDASTGSALKYNTNYNNLCESYRIEGMESEEKYLFFKTALPYCYQEKVAVNYTEQETNTKIETIKSLWQSYNSQNNSGTLDFNKNFNDIKTKANLFKATNVFTNVSVLSTPLTLKCAYDRLKTGADNVNIYKNQYGDEISSVDYYLNKDYYLGKSTTQDGTVKYVYNFAPGNTVTDTQTACERTCEEAVKVEYGPPIASKAGLCFEYKVKVSSYVKCTAKVIAKEPKSFNTYCNPAPICYSASGTLRKLEQAGPKEEFDKCINECDGGKYTEKCSIKCYNEIYVKNNPKLAINYSDVLAAKTAMKTEATLYSSEKCLDDNEGYFGCYIYEGNTIKWISKQQFVTHSKDQKRVSYERFALGRWYLDKVYKQTNGQYLTDQWSESANYDRNSGGYNIRGMWKSCYLNPENCKNSDIYIADEIGIYRHNKNNALCTDNCHWRSVGDTEYNSGNKKGVCAKTPNSVDGNDYLNPGSIEKDAKANQEAYEDAVRACIGTATCSEHTAEFTISLEYDTTTDGTKKTNKIAFPYSPATPSKAEPETLFANKDNNNANRNESLILAYDGCYSNKNAGNHYMTEWSFPGTYIHNKTGEISFKDQETDGWYYDDKRFCMPLDADSVNVKWWEWYKLGNTCYTRADIESELAGKTGTSNGYNIEANTKKFGYFGWNFDIKCFYGLRNEICNVDDTGCCSPTKKESGVSNYTFRSVALNNLFPNAADEGVINPDKREIGFNWTSKALSMKNDSYTVDPTALINHIENGASSIYSEDENLDYKFHLTPTDLAKIKEYNNNNQYATWDGKVELINGINVYRSNLFRDINGTRIIPRDKTIRLGCVGENNQIGTDTCMD